MNNSSTIDSKSKGNSDSENLDHIPVYETIPIFGGENGYWWILCVWKFWNSRDVPEAQRLQEAHHGLFCKALQWYWLWRFRNPTATWDTFEVAFLQCYQPEFIPVLPEIDQNEISDLDLQCVEVATMAEADLTSTNIKVSKGEMNTDSDMDFGIDEHSDGEEQTDHTVNDGDSWVHNGNEEGSGDVDGARSNAEVGASAETETKNATPLICYATPLNHLLSWRLYFHGIVTVLPCTQWKNGETATAPPPLVSSNDTGNNGSGGVRSDNRRREEQSAREVEGTTQILQNFELRGCELHNQERDDVNSITNAWRGKEDRGKLYYCENWKLRLTLNFQVSSMTPSLESHKKLFEQIVGFFVVEDRVFKTGSGLILKLEVEKLWDIPVSKLSSVLEDQFSRVWNANHLLIIKDYVNLLGVTGQKYGYPIDELLDVLMSKHRDKYHKLLLSNYEKQIPEALASFKFEWMLINKKYEYSMNMHSFHIQSSDSVPTFPHVALFFYAAEEEVERGSTSVEPEAGCDAITIETNLYVKQLIDFKEQLCHAPLITIGNHPFWRVCKVLGIDIACDTIAWAVELIEHGSNNDLVSPIKFWDPEAYLVAVART
ncbi:hypothetical protein PIB30_103425 [Stylosanthes scabra]|uniref:Exocyst complex subunit EXOC6/Sec15 C-terminal domain-containing protein n=1 Tax=Stylosanthes scabra TaxID=79078 RepID=A0ABU6WZN7_9FABA|nr:hypothetical protein [Stylosanthes scabra]